MNLAQKNHRFTAIFSLILLTLIFICHGLSLKAQFMIDDSSHLAPNQTQAFYVNFFDFFIRIYGHHYNPLDILLNFFVFKLFPIPAYLYAFNLLLFYTNCILLFLNVKIWTQNQVLAATTAILFCIHPINAENLSHITLNTIFFCAIFLQLSMLGFWKYICSPREHKVWFYLSLTFFLLGLLFLETALLFPAYLCLLCLIKPARERLRIFFLSLPFWTLSISYFILWFYMTQDGSQLDQKVFHLKISPISYLATLGLLSKWYLGNMFFPNDPVFIKSSAVITENLIPWISGLTISIVIIIVLIYRWRKTLKSFAILWFLVGFIFMFPASLMHAYQMGMVIEPNWFFFSSMGFFIFFASILADLSKKIQPVLAHTLLGTIVFFWIVSSYHHHLIAKSEISYLEYWLSISRGNCMPSFRLAYLYGLPDSRKIPKKMIFDMDRQVDLSIKRREYQEAANLIDKLILSAPEDPNQKIWESKQKALSIRLAKTPDNEILMDQLKSNKLSLQEYLLIAVELDKIDLHEQAISILDHSLSLYPNDVNTTYLKAIILSNQNHFKEALAILSTNPSNDARFVALTKQIHELESKFPE